MAKKYLTLFCSYTVDENADVVYVRNIRRIEYMTPRQAMLCFTRDTMNNWVQPERLPLPVLILSAIEPTLR